MLKRLWGDGRRRLMLVWAIVFGGGFLLTAVEAFGVFAHWIPLVIMGLATTHKALAGLTGSLGKVLAYWIAIGAALIGMTGLVFSGQIPYPSSIPYWGLLILILLGLAMAVFGAWGKEKRIIATGILWIIGGIVFWPTHISIAAELHILAAVTALPLLIFALMPSRVNSPKEPTQQASQ